MPSEVHHKIEGREKAGGPLALRLLGIYAELTKARLSALVLISALVSFLVADRGPLAGTLLLWTLVGTACCALGANALNQVWERSRDARMERTKKRPLPSSASPELAYSEG